MSTVDPDSTRRMGARRGVRGRLPGCADLGRPSAHGAGFCRSRRSRGGGALSPVLEAIGRTCSRWPLGAGNTLKLLNALMFSAINVMTAEMMELRRRRDWRLNYCTRRWRRAKRRRSAGCSRKSDPRLSPAICPTFTLTSCVKTTGSRWRWRNHAARPLVRVCANDERSCAGTRLAARTRARWSSLRSVARHAPGIKEREATRCRTYPWITRRTNGRAVAR